MAEKLITTKELSRQNIIGVKVVTQTRAIEQVIGGPIIRSIRRTKYLNICWMCGTPYESYQYKTYACSTRCSHNILYARKIGHNPPARMDQLTKEKNVKDVKERFGYL